MNAHEVFSPNYAAARERFRAATKVVDGELIELPIKAKGPQQEKLTIVNS